MRSGGRRPVRAGCCGRRFRGSAAPARDRAGEGVGEQRFGEDVGGGDGVLNGDVDADASDGGHGVGGVADAEESGRGPLDEAVDLDGEELDLVPGVDLGGAAGEEGHDAFDALVEGGEAFLLDRAGRCLWR